MYPSLDLGTAAVVNLGTLYILYLYNTSTKKFFLISLSSLATIYTNSRNFFLLSSSLT